MKITLHKKTKKYILIIIVLVLIITGIQAFKTIGKKEILVKENTVFHYSCLPEVNYSVIIHENELFNDRTLKEGAQYSKLLLESIKADFSIDYIGSISAPVKIDYQIFATVNGYQGQAPGKEVYWTKSFPLTDPKFINTEGDKWKAREQVSFDLSQYDAFASRAKEISGMKVSNEVVVELKGNITARASKEEIPVPFTAAIRVPLLEDVFKIEKEIGEPIDVNITETEEVLVPVNALAVGFLLLLILLELTVIFIVVFKIKEPDEIEGIRKKNNSLIKNYGSRMVAMKDMPDSNWKLHYRVYSIKDMIKISDEIQKPIVYVPDEIILFRDNELYIIDDDSLYRWNSA